MDSASLSDAGEIPQPTNISENVLPETRLESTVLDRIWMEKYRMLVAYKESQGHCNVSQSDNNNKVLRSWVANQRTSRRIATLRKDREQLLDDIGFVWSKPRESIERVEEQWDEKFGRLVDFKEKNGHFRVPIAEDKELNVWLNHQRSFQQAGTLRIDREQLFNDIGFSWCNPGPKRIKQLNTLVWMDKYKRLVAFKEKAGHFQVPLAEDKELSNWMHGQRKQFRLGKLDKEREELLNKIGFVWNARTSPAKEIPVAPFLPSALKSVQKTDDEPWNCMFVRLNDFVQKHSHPNIQAGAENQDLLEWVSLQRRLRKHGLLEAKHEKALQEIGLSWEIPAANESTHRDAPIFTKDEELWMSQFQSLCDYKKKNGHTDVPRTGEMSQLGHWLDFQQRFLGRGKLSEDKKILLSAVLAPETPAPKSSCPSSTYGAAAEAPAAKSPGTKPTNGAVVLIAEDPAATSPFLPSINGAAVLAAGASAAKSLGPQSTNGAAVMIAEAPKKGISCPVSNSLSVVLTAEVPTIATSGSGSSQIAVTEETKAAVALPAKQPETSVVDHNFDIADRGDAPSKLVSSQVKKGEPLGANQEFAIGTRIKKLFEVKKGVQKSFGGKVVSFEVFEEDDGARAWGYMIHYDDGDKEHMLEAEVAKHVVILKGKKRKKSEEKPKSTKRPKKAAVSVKDTTVVALNIEKDDTGKVKMGTDVAENARVNLNGKNRTKKSEEKSERLEEAVASVKDTPSIDLNKEKDDTVEIKTVTNVSENACVNSKGKKRSKKSEAKLKPSKRQKKAVASEKETTSSGLNREKNDTDEVKKGTDVSEKAHVKIVKRKKTKTYNKSGKSHEKPNSLSETKDTPPGEANSSQRLNEKLPNERTTSKSHSSRDIASNLSAIQSQAESIHARDKEAQEGQQSLQRKELDPASSPDEPRESSVRKRDHTRATEDELIVVGDSAGADLSHTFNDPLSNAEGRRRFPNGTRISRIFFDMSDNERTKTYVGKTVDYVYLDDERDWFYFVQYDDGDTEFMDDWEVTKFSAMV